MRVPVPVTVPVVFFNLASLLLVTLALRPVLAASILDGAASATSSPWSETASGASLLARRTALSRHRGDLRKPASAWGSPVTFNILHYNDVHGHIAPSSTSSVSCNITGDVCECYDHD